MKITAFLTTVLGAVMAIAAPPVSEQGKEPAKFGVMSLKSATPIHFAQLSAAKNNLFLNLKRQNATCQGPPQNQATFYIINEEMFLYTPSNKPVQRVFVDRSGMGQGKLGYLDTKVGLPRYGETKGWTIDGNDYLSFKGAPLLACPKSIDDAWSVWVSVGNPEPAGLVGCLGFRAKVIPNSSPVKCCYAS